MIKIDEKLSKQIKEATLVSLEFLNDDPLHEQPMQSIREDPILSLKRGKFS
jgi:hypothetical protein